MLSCWAVQVPAGTTVAALLSGASLRLAHLGGGAVRVLVNGEVAKDPMQLLTHGDQVCSLLSISELKCDVHVPSAALTECGACSFTSAAGHFAQVLIVPILPAGGHL